MRFMRGFAFGFLGFVLWVIASIFGALSLIGEQGLDADTADINPFWYGLMIIGFGIMFIAPLYYWILEPLFFDKSKKQTTPYIPPHFPSTQGEKYCTSCGFIIKPTDNFCPNCNTSQS